MDDKITLEEAFDRRQIDPDAIDRELVEQPDLVWRVGMMHVLAISQRDAHYEKMKKLKTKLAQRLRGGDDKMTVAAITAAVDSDKEVMVGRDKELELEDKVRRWEVAVDTVKSRGYSMHKVADMNLSYGTAIAGQSHGRSTRQADADAETQRAMRERTSGATTARKPRAVRDDG